MDAVSPPADVLIAGGGLAAARTARGLRELGFAGAIRLVSEEREAPYDRPPLSKDVLLTGREGAGLRLLDEAQAAELGIELLLGRRAVALQPRRRRVGLADGDWVGYGALVVATGARARRLPALDGFPGVHHLRTLGDARRLRRELLAQPRVAIVGGGFIGLEVAAAARALGCEVTVVEAAPEPLAAAVGERLGAAVRLHHEARGVTFRRSAALRSARGAGRIESLELADGTSLPADVVVVGVGVEANLEWLAPAGLELHRGVVCDADGRTALPGVYAAGDAACPHAGGRCIASEHWTAASRRALRVAAAIAGRPGAGAADDGYFWSDQYDFRIQFAGRAGARTHAVIVDGAVDSGSFVAHCCVDGAVTGVFAMNAPAAFVRHRLVLAAGAGGGAVPTRSR